jgi:type VI secretion system protein ImpA
MASGPVLDFDTLLAPIPDAPAPGDGDGAALAEYLQGAAHKVYNARTAAEKARKAEREGPVQEDGSSEAVVEPDWDAVVKAASDTLESTAKDLLLASRMTEALVQLHGFAGLRDGLRLLRQLADDHWDSLYPSLEDGDFGVRCAPFEWLDDPVRGARFPVTLRNVPLVKADEAAYSWHDWKPPLKGEAKVPREDFEKAMRAMPLESCQTLEDDMAQSMEELKGLTQTLHKRIGDDAPAMLNVRQSLEDCQTLMRHILQQKSPAAGSESDKPDGDSAGAPSEASSLSATARREDIYRQLALAAGRLKELEPHSPIPYLIERAVSLGGLPFPELIRALVRDANVLAELTRELGLNATAGQSEAQG